MSKVYLVEYQVWTNDNKTIDDYLRFEGSPLSYVKSNCQRLIAELYEISEDKVSINYLFEMIEDYVYAD